MIVNSTNPELNLKKGFVSSIILERGGQEMEDELSHEYKKGIEYGSIAVSSGQCLGFQKIFHCALYNRWVSTGNFSLKVSKNECSFELLLLTLFNIFFTHCISIFSMLQNEDILGDT